MAKPGHSATWAASEEDSSAGPDMEAARRPEALRTSLTLQTPPSLNTSGSGSSRDATAQSPVHRAQAGDQKELAPLDDEIVSSELSPGMDLAVGYHPLHQPALHCQNEDRRVEALVAEGLLDTPEDPELNDLVEIGRRAFGVSMCAINLIDRDRQWSKAAVGLSAKEVPRECSLCAHAIRRANTRRSSLRDILAEDHFVILDTAADKRFAYNETVSGKKSIRFYAGYPLFVSSNGEFLPIGTFCIMGTEARTDFAADDRKLLAAMACAARLRMEAIPRPDAQGPLASWAQEGGLELRLRMLKRCVAVAARPVNEMALSSLAERLRPRVYQKGQLITRQGQSGDSMFFVMVRVGEHELETHGAFQSFGEIALINFIRMRSSGVPDKEARERCVRGADVVALERCELLELVPQEAFDIIRTVPNLWFTLQEMAARRARKLLPVTQGQDTASSAAIGLDRVGSRIPVRQFRS